MYYDHARKLRNSPELKKSGLFVSLLLGIIIYLVFLFIFFIGSFIKKVGLINDNK